MYIYKFVQNVESVTLFRSSVFIILTHYALLRAQSANTLMFLLLFLLGNSYTANTSDVRRIKYLRVNTGHIMPL